MSVRKRKVIRKAETLKEQKPEISGAGFGAADEASYAMEFHFHHLVGGRRMMPLLTEFSEQGRGAVVATKISLLTEFEVNPTL